MNREFLIIGYKASAEEVSELNQKVAASGLNRSEFLRRLVAAADVEPPKIRVNKNSNASTYQGERIAVSVK